MSLMPPSESPRAQVRAIYNVLVDDDLDSYKRVHYNKIIQQATEEDADGEIIIRDLKRQKQAHEDEMGKIQQSINRTQHKYVM